MNKPPFRLLSGYSLDPGFSTRLDTVGINEIIYQIKWEDVKKGPCGDYFEVIDYDPASNCFYDPVDLNAIEVLAQNGLTASEGNPKFHQQFVYTIAMKTLEHFERSLGRKIIWPPRMIKKGGTKGQPFSITNKYVRRLRLYPHAFRDANAYYAPDKKAVLFGYFEAAAKIEGSNLPGGIVFTCLSPDIVAHELTHAILDSVHPRFIENTNPDVAAFHEAFADIVALLQRFAIIPLVEHQIAKTRGNIGEFSFLGELATQFGNALQSNRGSLRGAIGSFNRETGQWTKFDPDPERYHTEFEPHARGSLLVATIFDAFIRLYNVKTEDLIRIATNGSGVLQPGAIHPDLVKRLASAACEIAEHLLHICIRALDYCPPLDINYGDYLRALITADLNVSPKDDSGYRLALIEAFRSWGIFPDRVNTLSIESLQWDRPNFSNEEKQVFNYVGNEMKKQLRTLIDISLEETDNREEIYNESRRIQGWLHDLLISKKKETLGPKAWSAFITKLGLTDKPVTFKYEGQTISSVKAPPIEVHKVRPVYKIGRDGKLVEQVMITLTQTFRIGTGDLQGMKYRGGCTIILNMSREYDVAYIIYKRINSQNRFNYQVDYQSGKTPAFTAFADSMYDDDGGFKSINFAHLHFHNTY